MKILIKSKFLQISCLVTVCLIWGCYSGAAFANTTVTIIELNDFHGHLTPMPQIPGIVRVAGEIKLLEKDNPNSILVSGGDNYQGTVMSNLTYGATVNKMFRQLGVVASAVGNHEFDWGAWRIPGWAKQGGFSYLATNIYSKKTAKPVTWVKPYLIVKRAGEKIAFVGVSTRETPTTTRSKQVRNLLFKSDVKTAQQWINYLQAGKDAAGKPDAIIALTHIPSAQNSKTHKVAGKITGAEINNFCSKIKGLDAAISAHSHLLVNGKICGIPVIQAAKYGQALGLIKLTFNNKHNLLRVNTKLDLLSNRISSLPKDPAAAKIYNKYSKEFHKILDQKIGYASATFGYYPTRKLVAPLGAFICKIMLQGTDANVAIVNGGGIRSPLTKGKITVADVFNVFPFNNQVYVVKVTGAELKNILEHGILNPNGHLVAAQFDGAEITYDPRKPYGQHIVKLDICNQPLQPKKIYKLAVMDFMYSGGDGYSLKHNLGVYRTKLMLRNMLINYVKHEKVVTPQPVTYVKEVK